MTTLKQRTAAKKNIKKAQKKWSSMTSRQRAIAQPQGRNRAKPGSTGEGEYFRITIRPKNQFSSFKTQDVGERGGIQRVAGRRKSGSWDTQAWLISKDKAQPWGQSLKAKDDETKELLDSLGSKPRHITGDIYSAKSEINIPEKDKPTKAQKKAWSENIKKAQKARIK